MKYRYTRTAARELEQSVDHLIERAPHVASDFIDSVDKAIGQLLEHPYQRRKLTDRESAVDTLLAFATQFSTPSTAMQTS